MKKISNIKYILALLAVIVIAIACDKVEPTGVLIGHTSVNDRVKQSIVYYRDWDKMAGEHEVKGDYSFLVGSDIHLRDDLTRLSEMFDDQIANNDILSAHCGDLAETQPEYYALVEDLVEEYYNNYPGKFNFYPVVGNHDITRNGWAMYTKIFSMSTYVVEVIVVDDNGKEVARDALIFLDSANGTFGDYQLDIIDLSLFWDLDEETMDVISKQDTYRHKFVFTHTNFFRPRKNAFSSTLPREELYHMFRLFHDWHVDIVFCGHIHAWDDREYAGVRYITLDAMSADNNPEYGELVRCYVGDKVDCKTVRIE